MKISLLLNDIIKIPIIIFFLQLFSGCTGPSEKKNSDKIKTSIENQVLLKPPSSFSDTLIITSASAVFYNPDPVQLQKIKLVNKKMIFESLTHDCFYQMRNARMVLKKYWPQIQIIKIAKARYLLFIKADKSQVSIDLNTKNDICGIFIFNQVKDPELVDMTNIDTALEFYFDH